MDKINVTLPRSPLYTHSMLINEPPTQRETGFSNKEPTIATLQHAIGGKGDNKNIKVDFLVLH